VRDAFREEPVGEREELAGGAAELPDILTFGSDDAGGDAALVDVEAGAAFVKDPHVPSFAPVAGRPVGVEFTQRAPETRGDNRWCLQAARIRFRIGFVAPNQ
jgi:hypothetical protein